jgi:large subunit ribosomal protein L21
MFDEWLRLFWNSFLWWLPGADDNGTTSHGKRESQNAERTQTASTSTVSADGASEVVGRQAHEARAKGDDAGPVQEPTGSSGARADEAEAQRQPTSGHAEPVESAGHGGDDLTVIKGIGPTLAKKLDGLGIQTFADLAKADPEDLAARVNQRPVTAKRIQDWIADAKSRMG